MWKIFPSNAIDFQDFLYFFDMTKIRSFELIY